MIKSLKLINFQSHKNSLITLDPGVNVIIGITDSGKTSIIRALRKLVWNRPSGDAMRSTWGGTTAVTVQTEQDEVTWMKSDTESGYSLICTKRKPNTQTHFKAVGTDVPTEIRQALNIDEINLQSQLDSPFLLTSSPGEVAAHFNKVAKLNQIDEGLKNVNSWIREITRKTDASELVLSNSEQQLKEYDHLEKFDAEVEVLEGMETRRNSASIGKGKINYTIEEVKAVNNDIACEEVILEMEIPVTNLLDLIYKRDALEDGPLDTINSLIEEIKDIDTNLEDYTTLVVMEDQVEKLIKQNTLLESTQLLLHNLGTLINKVKAVDIDIDYKTEELQEKEVEFETLFPTTCPLCGKLK